MKKSWIYENSIFLMFFWHNGECDLTWTSWKENLEATGMELSLQEWGHLQIVWVNTHTTNEKECDIEPFPCMHELSCCMYMFLWWNL